MNLGFHSDHCHRLGALAFPGNSLGRFSRVESWSCLVADCFSREGGDDGSNDNDSENDNDNDNDIDNDNDNDKRD